LINKEEIDSSFPSAPLLINATHKICKKCKIVPCSSYLHDVCYRCADMKENVKEFSFFHIKCNQSSKM
jgi:hypothetical protein